ncbi:hypothetical protein I4U23_017065 [Adineta vaga]|nr:hypothetical protein I4U23_017065 [Adineta vaga]
MNYLSGILLYNSILLTLNITTSKALSSINITQDLSNFLQNHATLTTLCLQNIQIDYQRIEILSSALKGLRKLETLILSRVNMRPIVAESLANALDNITTLSILRLDSNRIGDKGIQFLMKIFKINALKEIDLSNNQLGYGDGIQILAEFLQANTTLLKLNLSNNQIAFSGSKYLSNALEKNTTLTSLYLRSDNIDDRGIENLSQALKINKTLEHIDVSNNPFGNNGIEYFQVLLQVNKTLTELQIGFKYDKYQGNLVQKSETKEVMDE